MTVREGQVNPLRPPSVGDLINTTFRQYRVYFPFLSKVLVFLLLPFLIVQSIINYQTQSRTGSTIRQLAGNIFQASGHHPLLPLNQPPTPPTPVSIAGNLIIGLILIIMYPLIYGVILHFIARTSMSDESVGFGESLRYSAKRWFSVIVTDFFLGIISVICLGIAWGVVIGAIAALSTFKVSLAVTIPAGIVLVLGAILLTLWLVTRVAMTSSVVREEKRIFWPAIARSWVLTRGNFWRSLGYIVLIVLMVEVIQGAIMGVSFVLPAVLSVIVIGIGTLFLAPFQMLAMANLYVDLRIRTDAMDLGEWLTGIEEHEELRD